MRTIIRAELRDSWRSWVGVSLGFVVTGFGLALAAMVLQSALSARETVVPFMEADAYAFNGGINLVFCLIVGLSVVASSTALVVDGRRGALARLALAGATPGAVVATVGVQLLLVALAAAAVGDLLAVAVLRPTLAFLMLERGAESAGIATPPVTDLRTLLGVNAAWVVVALVGGLRHARRASRIPPVEALRQAQGTVSASSAQGIGRWLRAGIALLMVVGFYAMVPVLAADPNSETFTQIMQANLTLLCVTGWLLADLSPTIVRPLTAAWTRWGPMGEPTWLIARATVLARSGRLARSVTPVMFTVGLAFGVIGLPATYNATFAASGFDVRLGHAGPETFLVNLGLPLAIALSGSVGSLYMMSTQRQADLALLGIAGATVRQRTATAALEAVIVTGTAALLGGVMALTALLHIAWGSGAVGLVFAVGFPVLELAAALLVSGLVTVAATVLPTIPTQRLPEPSVVARLIAE